MYPRHPRTVPRPVRLVRCRWLAGRPARARAATVRVANLATGWGTYSSNIDGRCDEVRGGQQLMMSSVLWVLTIFLRPTGERIDLAHYRSATDATAMCPPSSGEVWRVDSWCAPTAGAVRGWPPRLGTPRHGIRSRGGAYPTCPSCRVGRREHRAPGPPPIPA